MDNFKAQIRQGNPASELVTVLNTSGLPVYNNPNLANTVYGAEFDMNYVNGIKQSPYTGRVGTAGIGLQHSFQKIEKGENKIWFSNTNGNVTFVAQVGYDYAADPLTPASLYTLYTVSDTPIVSTEELRIRTRIPIPLVNLGVVGNGDRLPVGLKTEPQFFDVEIQDEYERPLTLTPQAPAAYALGARLCQDGYLALFIYNRLLSPPGGARGLTVGDLATLVGQDLNISTVRIIVRGQYTAA